MQKRPRIKIVSDTIQEFMGVRYYLCGHYFQHKGSRLHRRVWEAYRGEIPKGQHVHHQDGDVSNNRIANLQMVSAAEHRRIHGPNSGSSFTEEDRGKAAERHKSEAGLEWHREHYKRHSAKALHEKGQRECEWCGSSFTCRVVGVAKFCSGDCKARSRRASGVDNETRECVTCGTSFVVNKYWKTQNCSRSCGRQKQLINERQHPQPRVRSQPR